VTLEFGTANIKFVKSMVFVNLWQHVACRSSLSWCQTKGCLTWRWSVEIKEAGTHKGTFDIQLNLLLPYLICKLDSISKYS